MVFEKKVEKIVGEDLARFGRLCGRRVDKCGEVCYNVLYTYDTDGLRFKRRKEGFVMETRQYPEDRRTAESHLLTGMAFLSENPEAYGFVPDACPVVTSDLLVAVNGQSAMGGVVFPTYPVERGGVDGLFDALFGGLIHRTDDNARLLRATFGESEGMQEHPIARYCAALAEAVALQILNGPARGASFEQTCLMLGGEIPRKLARLRETVCGDGLTSRDSVFFTVSFGACRVTPEGGGDYTVDIFAAGDFRVFLLDGEGLHPLWLTDTSVLSPDSSAIPTGKSLAIHHPEPFAVLLLSDSICAPGAAETRALRENPGMIWRYRMRLEDQLLRLITSCVREQEFGERAARFFMGRSRGRDSASGAMTILREGASYEVFRSVCQTRLARLEDMIALMPEGYDPDRVPEQLPLEEVERNHLRRLLEQDAGLSDRVSEALRLCSLDKLRKGKDDVKIPLPADVPAYRRLGRDEVWETYRRYDRENDTDRARVEENRRILRENLTDHWIALRPHLLKAAARPSSVSAERSYAACAEMNRRLGMMLTTRKKTLASLERLLSDSLSILRADGKDWLEGRAGDCSVASWAEGLADGIPAALLPVLSGWREETRRYRSLLTAYTYERELLFRMDISRAEGFFADDWQAIYDGTMTAPRWNALRDSLDTPAAYRDLLESLRRVSKGTGALLARIESRGAERRMARELANRADLQIAALRASAYEDQDWGESVVAIMDTPRRREHRDIVRRWHETRELDIRRAASYAAYSAAYGAYLNMDS